MGIARNKLGISVVIMVALLISPAMASAQTSTADWSRLNTVSAGSKLSVNLKSGKTVAGKLASVSDTTLSLTVKDKAVDIKREDITSVYQLTKKSATKATLIGLGVGAGAGAAIGLAGRDDNGFDKLENSITAGLAVLGAGAGALTGYLIGRGSSKRVLIYQSQP